MQVTFRDYETTAEIASTTGATLLFVKVRYGLERDGIAGEERRTVSVTTEQGRRRYDLVDEGAPCPASLEQAIIAYVKEAERRFRCLPPGRDRGSLERIVRLPD